MRILILLLLGGAIFFGSTHTLSGKEHQEGNYFLFLDTLVYILPGTEKIVQIGYNNGIVVSEDSDSKVTISMYDRAPVISKIPVIIDQEYPSVEFPASARDSFIAISKILPEKTDLKISWKGGKGLYILVLQGASQYLDWRSSRSADSIKPLFQVKDSDSDSHILTVSAQEEYFIIQEPLTSDIVKSANLMISTSSKRYQRPDNTKNKIPGLRQMCAADLGECHFNLSVSTNFILVSATMRDGFTRIESDDEVAPLEDQLITVRFQVGSTLPLGSGSRRSKRRFYLVAVSISFVVILVLVLACFMCLRRGIISSGVMEAGYPGTPGGIHGISSIQMRTFVDHRNQLLHLFGVEVAAPTINEWDGEPLPAYEPPKENTPIVAEEDDDEGDDDGEVRVQQFRE